MSLREFNARRPADVDWRHRIVEVRTSNEQSAEHVTELLAHGAVDEEVEWVCDGDAAVHELRGRVTSRVAEQVDVERVLDDDEQQQHRQRYFDFSAGLRRTRRRFFEVFPGT